MWTLLILIGTIIFLVWWLSSPFYWRKRNVPYLLPLPLFGNFLPMLKYGAFDYNKVLYKIFPDEPFYGLHFFTRPALVVKDPDLIQRILVTDNEHFAWRGFYSKKDRDPVGNNLFHISGQQWKELRGVISRNFTPARLRVMLSYVDDTLQKMLSVIDKNIQENRATEVISSLTNLSTHVLMKSLFGVESDAFENKDSKLNQLARGIFSTSLTFSFIISVVSHTLYELLNLTIFSKRCTDILSEVVHEMVEYRRKENVRNINDYLEGMMELMDNYEEPKEKFFPDGTPVPRYDVSNIICQAGSLIAGGDETSGIAMSFLLYDLALHPEIQERCREEVNAVAKESGGQVNVGDLSKLVYLGAAIQESLRIHPPVYLLNRECTKDYQIPGSQVLIEKGTFLLISSIGMHMNSKYFPQPHLFRPERFLNENFPSGTYFPFGIGPRTCIGMGLVNAEMRLVVSKLLQLYEFSVCRKTDVPMRYNTFGFITQPLNDIWLNIRPIMNKNSCDI